MDSKFSDFPKSQSIGVTDFFPIVKDGDNQTITAGALFLNLPNFGNKGITKNAVVVASGASVPLTGSLVVLPPSESSFDVPAGSDGQEITFISLGSNYINYNSEIIEMQNGSTMTMVYLTIASKWFITSYYDNSQLVMAS